ncbi:MAG: hypothetical protein ACPMAQ_15340 [Phycisphaerae bacterium]
MKPYPLSFTVLVAVGIVAAGVLWVHAGSLTPPAGPVAPTMKTLDEISGQIAALPPASIKRIVRGVIAIPRGAGTAEGSSTFSPAIDPSRSVVLLSDAVFGEFEGSVDAKLSRNGACLVSLSSTQITVRVDNLTNVIGVTVSYQIIEYN